MITLPEEFSKQISAFAPLFSKKVFEHAKVLVTGALLVVGRRTVCSALRAVGLHGEKRFHKYHRVLSLAKWSPRKAAAILLRLLVDRFVAPGQPLVFGIDETLERRWGSKIKARGIYRDSVRSSHSHFVKSSGLRWICLMLLVPMHWANRVWALPFLTVLAASERYYQNEGKKHKKLTDWARQMILQLKRWLPGRQLVIVGDASYSCYNLLDAVRSHVCMISRLRLDARLFDFPPPRPKGKLGPIQKVGKRQPTLQERLDDPQTQWQTWLTSEWYGQKQRVVRIATGTALWYKSSYAIVPLRWILIKDSQGELEPVALLCTGLDMQPIDAVAFFVRRWTVEVTFEEVRMHLGVESQRQWADKAIARATPALMALFSIVALWADELHKAKKLNVATCAWYQKPHPTFSDAIASVRRQIWRNQKFLTSYLEGDVNNSTDAFFSLLVSLATRAA